jgi:hypothetical protein
VAAAAGIAVSASSGGTAALLGKGLASPTSQSALATSQQANGTVCRAGTAPVKERAVVGHGKRTLCIKVGRNLTGSTHVDPFLGKVSSMVIDFYYERTGENGSAASKVVCWSQEDWLSIGGKGLLGFVWPGTGVVNLSPQVCAELDELVYDGARVKDYDTAEAVDTLAHESIHVAGELNEARTECYAMQLTQYTSEQLGTNGQFGFDLGGILLADYESWKGTEYYTSQCHNGSQLDLYPDSELFP